jgi:hypothetical protein
MIPAKRHLPTLAPKTARSRNDRCADQAGTSTSLELPRKRRLVGIACNSASTRCKPDALARKLTCISRLQKAKGKGSAFFHQPLQSLWTNIVWQTNNRHQYDGTTCGNSKCAELVSCWASIWSPTLQRILSRRFYSSMGEHKQALSASNTSLCHDRRTVWTCGGCAEKGPVKHGNFGRECY